MPIQVTCRSCQGMFNAPDTAGGKRTKCPTCGGIIEIPMPVVEEEILDAEPEPARFSGADFDVEPPAAVADSADRKPCPKCGEMIQKVAIKCRFCGAIFDPAVTSYQQAVRSQRPGAGTATLFLHIPVTRLIVMSLLTVHLYETYWIYKNWQFIKKRDNLSIWPFWRGIFGIFFCHSLLKHIHQDKEARAVEQPTFSPGLAGGWIVLIILSNLVSRAPGTMPILISAFMPSFLCLVPVQKYINSITQRQTPGEPYYRWSIGHIVCIVLGVIIWFGLLMIIIVGEENL